MATIINRKKQPWTYEQLRLKFPRGVYSLEQREGNLALLRVGELLYGMSEEQLANQKAKARISTQNGMPVSYRSSPCVWVQFADNELLSLELLENQRSL